MALLKILGGINAVGKAARDMRWGREAKSLAILSRDKDKRDLLFEFWCYISLVREFHSHGYKVTLQNPPGLAMARWPMKAANPANFSFFSFVLGRSTYRICPGVEVEYKQVAGSHCAPDISIRRQIGTVDYVYRCWDAKYRSKPEQSITRSEVYTFSVQRQMIPMRKSDKLDTAFVSFGSSSCFSVDGIISNGSPSSEQLEMLKQLKCAETTHFGTRHQATRS